MPSSPKDPPEMKPRAGSKALIREINEALVLDVVRAQGPVARAVIAARTGLSAATVTGIAGKLLQSGLLSETDAVPSTGGRPARLLELGTETVLAAGVRLSGTEAFVTLVNLRGDSVASHREALPSTRPEAAEAAIARAVATASALRPEATLTGVGVAVSGVVDQATGMVRHSGSLGWENVPLRDRLTELTGTPVVLDSYVNSFASGLLLFDGRLAGRDLLLFSVGPSLGASVVVKGRIHRGFNGSAGGFAHSRVCADIAAPRPCHCGAANCLETWSSHWGIRQELERRGADAEDLCDDGGAVMTDAADKLGTAMANAAKMFGPERVVMAFTHEMNLPAFAARTERMFRLQYAHENTPAPELELAVADEPALARGAAYNVLARMFTAEVSESDVSRPAQV